MTPLPKEKSYTLADLLTWDDGTRYELYDGKLVAMASPSNAHQLISNELSRQLSNYLFGKQCKVYPAPFDVQPFAKKEDSPETITTVVQPDISIVCDPEKTGGHGCKGAPDMIIEITSPSTGRTDNLIKFHLYRQACVREYWIVEPDIRVVSVYTLKNGNYYARAYDDTMLAPVNIFEDCVIDLPKVFEAALLEKEEDVTQ